MVLEGPPGRGDDPELDAVTDRLYEHDPSGDRVAKVLRETIDQLLDGRRSGRWDYVQLHKTEKTHMGTLVEINLHREFNFADGVATDYRIAGHDVDCKFSQRIGGWEMGPEMVDQLCLVIWASDLESRWRAGLVRARQDRLRLTANRDAKRRLTERGVTEIRWLWSSHGDLAPNVLLHLDPLKRERIMNACARRGDRHAQARLFQLCRDVHNQIITRATVETVGWGLDDPLKRMRSNGGARDALRPEGLLVLGHQDNDPGVASALGLPVPQKGQFVVTRVVPAGNDEGMPVASIQGQLWRKATRDDPPHPAPVVPRS
ncbi:restriction endonuclease [Amycolatopsis sp. WAC 01376]|uniref:NaeI family type II restriction endonuclease n=1 Tax=Amycolatopsis sp. WAC 01376 TaxID=2203195 RepID=UPI000F781555|nr:NaeI family type II restriction endonuclease [Amycolatopsis sp. WAC 01376]RSM67269.1 restriction endonuclease [Amycolatopsis sp. WAC 01376]